LKEHKKDIVCKKVHQLYNRIPTKTKTLGEKEDWKDVGKEKESKMGCTSH